MFGLSHQGLIEGGRALLEEKGNVGESLFSAGLGGLGVHHLLKQLEGKAEAIFKPGGKNPPLNQAISAFKKAKKDASDQSLQTKDWEALQDELKAQRALSLAIETELQTLRTSERRLRRIHGALAPVAHRSEVQQQLAELAHVIVLPDKAAEERRAAQTILADAAPRTTQLEAELDDLRAKSAALTVPDELLSREAAMKQLRNDLGGHLKAASDLPRRRAELRLAEDDAKSLLQKLGSAVALDEIETLRVKTTVETRMSALGKQRGKLESALSAAHQAQTDLEEKLELQRRKQAALPVPLSADRLRRAADLARKDGDLEKRSREQHAECEAMQAALARGHRSLGLWHGPLEAIGELAMPVAESIDRFEKSASDLAKELAKEATLEVDRLAKIAQIEEQLEAQQRRAAVPTEADLAAARRERERTWSLVRQAWLDDGVAGEPTVAGPALAAEHEGHTRGADEVADRLRREADSVAELASLLARKTTEEHELAKIEARRGKLEVDQQADAERWRALWTPLAIEPLSPIEMRSWLLRYHKLADDRTRRLDALRSLDGLTAQIAAHRQALGEGLTASDRGAPVENGESGNGETLAALVARAEEVVKHVDGLARERSSLAESILALEGDAAKTRGVVEQHSAALEKWKHDWAAVTAALGLDENALPEEAEKVVEQRKELLSKAEARKGLLHRVAAMEADACAFTERVDELVQTAAPDLSDRTV
ncbi:MAG: AAA family ATPase, partial [Byssovorax sp.]